MTSVTRFISLAGVLAIWATAPQIRAATPDLSAEAVTVGRNLQMYSSIRLAKAAPAEGVQVTVTSDDPSRLLLAKGPDQAGTASITLKIVPQAIRSAEFALQGRAASGTVSYTISAPGLESGKGEVTLTPSAIVIVGPFKAPRYPTTPRGQAGHLTLISVALDSAGKILGDQALAGGSQLEVQIANSNPGAVSLKESKLMLTGGSSTAVTAFQPAAEGDTTLTPVQPAGFTTPADRASIIVAVEKPALAITGDIFIGKDLQTPAPIVLGEPAPPGGVNVTLKSADASRMVFSTKEDEPGAASITIAVPEGARVAPSYIQALGDSGEVEYTASAPGYRSSSARIELAKSGVILAYEAYGPPDEANVKRKIGGHTDREFFVSLADAKVHPVRLVVFTAYIDRESGRSADFTVQPLRGGMSTTVMLKSSNPEVATIETPLTIKPGFNRAVCLFTPLTQGKTVITVDTPAGFSTPGNGIAAPATVRE